MAQSDGPAPAAPAPMGGEPEANALLYPMWVVPVQVALELNDLPTHQELKAKGQVLEFVMGVMVGVFVSHQWTGLVHADPDMRQFRILQATLQNILQYKVRVQGDGVHQSVHKALLKMTDAQVAELASAHIWYDWFSCPQVAARQINQVVSTELQACVDSIARYVQMSNYFMVLVPNVVHYELADTECCYVSWKTRGWCRLELFAWALAVGKPPLINIQSPYMVHFANAVGWMHDPPGAGQFTVEADRSRAVQQTQALLEQKLRALRLEADLHDWRFFKALRTRLLQGASEKFGYDRVESFLADFELRAAGETCEQGPGAGWTPLHYAAIAGGQVVGELVALRCEPNGQIQGTYLPALLVPGTTPLYLATEFGPESSARALLQLRADPCLSNSQGLNAFIIHATLPTAQPQLLMDLVSARANVNQAMAWPASMTALHMAAWKANAGAVSALLELRADTSCVSISGNALMMACLNNNEGAVKALLQARMDPDFQWNTRGTVYWTICMVARVATYMGAASELLNSLCICDGGTPLLYAARGGNPKMVRLLLAAGADAHRRTTGGQTARDLAEIHGHGTVARLLEQATQAAPKSSKKVQTRACSCGGKPDDLDIVEDWFTGVDVAVGNFPLKVQL